MPPSRSRIIRIRNNNYIGIGLYEAWLCHSLVRAKLVTRAWKLFRWFDIPTAGTFRWLEYGHKYYKDNKPENDPCCICPFFGKDQDHLETRAGRRRSR